MASEPVTPTPVESAGITEVPGRVNPEGLDGLSSDAIQSGTIKQPSTRKTKSNKGRGRGDSGSGSGTEEASAIEGDRKLPVPPAADNPFAQSDNILQTIADRFVKARELQKAEAWRQLQVDLMYASPFICPVIIPYKDLIGIVSDIEKEIKGGTAQVGKSNEEIMADFLSGSGSLVVATSNLEPDLTVDRYANMESGEGNDGPVKDIPLSTDDSKPPLSSSPASPSS